jgi:hypothetical protein
MSKSQLLRDRMLIPGGPASVAVFRSCKRAILHRPATPGAICGAQSGSRVIGTSSRSIAMSERRRIAEIPLCILVLDKVLASV